MEVRERFPSTARIMLTGYATLELALEAINRAEVHRFLLKPCSFVELGKVVREALSKRAVRHETRRLLDAVRAQAALLDRIESEAPEALERCVDLDRAELEDDQGGDEELIDQIRYETEKFEQRRQRLRGEATKQG